MDIKGVKTHTLLPEILLQDFKLVTKYFFSILEKINHKYNQNVNFISDFKAVLMSIECVRNRQAQRQRTHVT